MKQRNADIPQSIPNRQGRLLAGGLVIAGVALMITALLIIVMHPKQNEVVRPPRVGQPMSNLVLTTPDGGSERLANYQGQTVIINVWATWCPPCRLEMPVLNDYYQAHQAEGLALLAINAGEDAQTAADFASANQLAFPVFIDPNYELLTPMGIDNYPTSIVIGRDGVVKYIHVGAISANVLEQKVTPLLK